jgi:hypothetical protein
MKKQPKDSLKLLSTVRVISEANSEYEPQSAVDRR